MMEEVPLTRSWPGAHGDGAAWVWMERPLHPGVRLSCGSAPGGKSVGSGVRGSVTHEETPLPRLSVPQLGLL